MHAGTGIAAVIFWALPLTAAAGDGVAEISQACAESVGCFAEDAPGFPVTISRPGSYRLTSDLIVSEDPDSTAISIEVSDVDLDLNGFSLDGPASCSSSPPECSPAGAGLGIAATTTAQNTSIANGAVKGFAGGGIRIEFAGRLESPRVVANGSNGIHAAGDALVVSNQVIYNAGIGVVVGTGSRVSGNAVSRNAGGGISAGTGSSIVENVAIDNWVSGILASTGSSVASNTAHTNRGVGIQAGNGSSVIGNVARDNTGLGLVLGSGTGFSANTIQLNNLGNENPQVSGGLEIGLNVCGNDTTCP